MRDRTWTNRTFFAQVVLLALPWVYLFIPALHRYLSLALLIIAVLIISALLPLPRLLEKASARLIIGFSTAAAFIQIESIISWAVKLPADYVFYVFSLTLLAFYACALNWPLRPHLRQGLHRLVPAKADLVVVASGLIVCLLVLTGSFKHGVNQAAFTRLSSISMDDVSHLSMFSDEYRHGGEMLLGRPYSGATSIPGFGSYPKGWHVATAAAYSSAAALSGRSTTSTPLTQELTAYTILKLLSILLLVSALSLAAEVFNEYRLGRRQPGASSAVNLIYTLFISVILVLPILWEGFFSFLPVIIYMLLLGTFMLCYTRAESPQIKGALLVFMLLCCAGSALSWLLAAPAFFGSLAMLLALNHRPMVGSVRRLIRNYPAMTAVLSVILLACIAAAVLQAATQVLYSPGAISAISESGGITAPNATFIILLFAAFFGWIYYVKAGYSREVLLAWVLPIFMLAGIALLYELLKGTGASYYFYKLELLGVFALAIPAYAAIEALVSAFSAQAGSFFYRYSTASMLTLLLILGATFTTLNLGDLQSDLRDLGGIRTLTLAETPPLDNYLSSQRYGRNNTRLLYFIPSNPFQAVMATHLARLSHPLDKCDGDEFDEIYKNDFSSLVATLKTCAPNTTYKFHILTESGSYDKFSSELKSQIDSGKVMLSRIPS